jgi:hypothetical protein
VVLPDRVGRIVGKLLVTVGDPVPLTVREGIAVITVRDIVGEPVLLTVKVEDILPV